ncbi:cytidylate kinase [Geomicrobium halophilum]|uniref:Cytidylate kinase n=1 Tax=Geomicrobium halophilum TaxID=549000 RepID=A0A841PJG9_9BACL|nr:(d)CMP kinase [Geomicrobium halophilum]MBB6449017.1 cytidylate kinase [Geomicrobium halophilum]
MHKINIAIDGPAGSGKSTVARKAAEQLFYLYLDTGAMYRFLTFRALREGIPEHDEEALLQLLTNIEFSLVNEGEKGVKLSVNGGPLGEGIRSQAVTEKVSAISAHEKIRKEMVTRQQQLAKEKGVVLDGRDIGTFVLPEAELKIYLYASVDERSRRRYLENLENHRPSDIDVIKEEITRRDHLDSTRQIAPLTQAKDAFPLDTTNLTIEEAVAHICHLAREKEKKGQ